MAQVGIWPREPAPGDEARPAPAQRDGHLPPLYGAVPPGPRRQLRVLSPGLLHHEVQPQDQRGYGYVFIPPFSRAVCPAGDCPGTCRALRG